MKFLNELLEGGRFSNDRMAKRLDAERKARPQRTSPEDLEYEAKLKELGQRLKRLEKNANKLDEMSQGERGNFVSREMSNQIKDWVGGNVHTALENARKRYVAAVRGLGIANKLKNPKDRKKHKSRTMTIMNILDKQLSQIEKKMR